MDKHIEAVAVMYDVDGEIIGKAQLHDAWEQVVNSTSIIPLYPQEYVDSLIAKLEAAQKELSAANEKPLTPVILEIANERRRQISVEGWTPEHDDQHSSGELAGAAGCYAKHVNARQWCFKNNPDDYQCELEPSGWPWEPKWWKPKNPRSDLIRAAALIVAELERLDRASKLVEGNADAE